MPMKVSDVFAWARGLFSRAFVWLFRLRHIESFSKHLDARVNLPRPANEQYLSSYKAGLRLLNDCGIGFLFFAATVASCYFLYDSYHSWRSLLPDGSYLVFVGLALFGVLLLALDVGRLNIPYLRLTARETFGSAHWASLNDLLAAGFTEKEICSAGFCGLELKIAGLTCDDV